MSHSSRLITNDRLSPVPRTLNVILMLLAFLTMVLPLLNVFATAFSTRLGSMTPGILLWPKDWTFEGFLTIWNRGNISRAFWNSAFVTLLAVAIQILLSTLAAYVLIQKQLPGRRFLVGVILLTLMIPGDLTLISMYSLNSQLHLLNSYAGLILNGLVSGFAIVLLRNYFESVPEEMAEAARMDSASEGQVFSRIYLPLAIPGIASVTFLEFIGKWNSLMIPATIISDPEKYTLPVVLRELTFANQSVSGIDYIAPNAKMAAVVISVIPLIVLYVLAQRYLIEGLTLGATKG